MSKSLALLPLLSQVKDVFKSDSIKIDSFVAQLHYRVTYALFLAACLIVSSYQYFGKPIQCIQEISGIKASIPDNVINTYCFIQSTYTNHVSGHFGENQRKDPSTVNHAYYQWTPLVLFIGALLSAAPHYLWQYIDNGFLAACLEEIQPSLDHKKYTYPVKNLARYLSQRFHSLGIWAFGNYLQDVLQTINAIVLFLCADIFLKGFFFQYGLEVLNFYMGLQIPFKDSQQSNIPPMERVFPKMTKCEFTKFGPSGTIQRHDALCLMAINIINDKVFLATWYWLLGLFLISATFLLFRTMRLFAVCLRKRCALFKKLTPLFNGSEESEFLLSHLKIGDLIFLEQVQANFDQKTFKYLMTCICNYLTDSRRESFSEAE